MNMLTELSLHPLLNEATQTLGFESATEVQKRAVPLVLDNKDLLVSAATGSGKTVAFLLPILHRILAKQAEPKATRALVLVPVRELADQIVKAGTALAQLTSLKLLSVTGGKDFKVQERALKRLPDIVVATPGRLIEHLENESLSLSELDVLVLDEADRMLDMGFQDNVLNVMKYCPAEHQTLLFSATLPSVIRRFAEEILNEPESVLVHHHREQHGDIQQQIVLADDIDHKEKLLRWLLDNETYEKAIVFTNSKILAARLDGLMRYHKFRAAQLHGDIQQKGRQATIESFRTGKVNVLIATDLAARGLDVGGIDLVINFDMPRKGDAYVHRIGRTGRAGAEGKSISFIAQTEWNLMSSIERYLKVRFERKVIKALPATYKGPKKLKASGKAASSKKKKKPAAKGKLKVKKVKKTKKS
ncbi:DEAD/DEAH box helicase [Alkalimarinus sediminis]|uniref:DEAD/DEAH box helicase n=1 Tax=Alkalimarinus sediminis TaxID=1632866 RepID=A0A9E8KJJ6_9ALTE|nr:DEAD/DEAH box helicase [Alkalimarinus sediminis]UZW75126.1 DEAD/DEAH box helicase [Alkalimarinus sediminis]